MKILHIQTSMGPAGNAAYRLHCAMLKTGIESNILTFCPTVKRNNVFNLNFGLKIMASKVASKIMSSYIYRFIKTDCYPYSSMPILSKNISLHRLVRNADIIYLHWICGQFLGIRDIESLAQTGKPIIFFMHDMWTFTGGCHHSLDCSQYKNGCKNCAMFNKYKFIATKQNKNKTDLFHRFSNFYFISPSEWMAKCAKSSSVLKDKPIIVIPNIVDETIFKPIEKHVARNILNLPNDKLIITFGCQAGTGNTYKGWEYLRDAMIQLSLQNIHVVIYGSDYQKQTTEEVKYPITFLGAIFDEYILSLICNATDIFVSPSLAESFGLTFLENILCGTPVVGFNCTAVPEIIKTGKNGYLARYKDATDLANGIYTLSNDQQIAKGREEYSTTEIVNKHINTINTILYGK